MANGYFFINSNGGERLSPSQYGYWLVRWSHDNSISSLERLKEKNFAQSPLAKAISAASFWGYIQFMAIHIASYWFYASELLKVNEDQVEMRVGLDDGIKDLRQGNGEVLSDFQEQLLRGSIGVYLNANIEDIFANTSEDQYICKPDASALARKFLDITTPLYPDIKSGSIADQMLIGHFIADIPIYLLKALQEEIRMTYVKNN